MNETMELMLVTAQNAVQIFTGGGMNAILEDIEAKVRAIPLDPSTHSGREQIRSVAYRIARTKTALDSEGKKLTEGWRQATAKVNEERKKSIERLEALQEEVRRPLTDFENKEKRRVAAHEEALGLITGLHAMVAAHPDMALALLLDHQADFQALPERDWEEFAERAGKAGGECARYLESRIEARRKYDTEQEELARLRKAELERQQRERDERLKAEAAEKARLEAERKAKAEADAEAKRVVEAAERERQRVERMQREAEERRLSEERAKLEAQRRAKEAEDARIAAERKAAEDLRKAEERAKEEQARAVQVERQRVAKIQREEEDARRKREANQLLRAKVRSEMRADIATILGAENDYASAIADALLDGRIRHARVVF